MLPAPGLLALATAVPPFILRQSEVAAHARRLFPELGDEIERLLPVYENAGIETRYSCVPVDWYQKKHGWVERNRLYIDNAVALLERATLDCLAAAGCGVEEVDGIVAVSTSGIATPSLDALLMERLGMRRDVQRLPIFGLGCAGGVLGLARAAALAQAAPEQKILFLVVELCGLTFRRTDQSKSNVIASALFGDGAAAALIGCTGNGSTLTAWGEHTWPNSLDVMGWRVEEDGLGVLFSRDIPALVREQLRPALEDFLGRRGLGLDDIDSFLCHPGGAKVLAAFEAALGLDNGVLDHARAVLREYGNMSAASVMFVLDRALKAGDTGRYLLSALGPGFTAAFLTMEVG